MTPRRPCVCCVCVRKGRQRTGLVKRGEPCYSSCVGHTWGMCKSHIYGIFFMCVACHYAIQWCGGEAAGDLRAARQPRCAHSELLRDRSGITCSEKGKHDGTCTLRSNPPGDRGDGCWTTGSKWQGSWGACTVRQPSLDSSFLGEHWWKSWRHRKQHVVRIQYQPHLGARIA